MRSRSFQKAMLQLATIAMLLLALVPTLMRLGSHGEPAMTGGAGSHGGPAMHMMADGSMMKADPATPNRGDGVCAYCPLLAGLTLLAFVLLVLPALRLPGWIPLVRPCARHPLRRHPCGLGSRGPPLQA